MTKTVEQLQAEIESALASIKKLEGLNDTLKLENKTFSSKVAEALSEKEAAQEKADREAGNIEALERRLTTKFQNEMNAITKERDTLANDLRTVRVDNEIKSALTSNKVMAELSEGAEALLLRKVQYEDGVATIDGKSIQDAAKALFNSKAGAYYVAGPDSSGSGSTGATSAKPASRPFNETEYSIQRKTDPVGADAWAKNTNNDWIIPPAQ